MDEQTALIKLLKKKYGFGSLYLTFIPLNDLTHLLNEPAKFAALTTEEPSRTNLKALKAFLDNHRELPMNQAVAFVQLDFVKGRAGWKQISDRDGTLRPISWSNDQVSHIAKFCDDFLIRLIDFDKTYTAIASGSLGVVRAWTIVQELKEQPLVSTAQIAALKGQFKNLVQRNSQEMIVLKARNRQLHDAIRDFAKAPGASIKFPSKPVPVETIILGLSTPGVFDVAASIPGVTPFIEKVIIRKPTKGPLVLKQA